MHHHKHRNLLAVVVIALTAYLSVNIVIHGSNNSNPTVTITTEDRALEEQIDVIKNNYVSFSYSNTNLNEKSLITIAIVDYIDNCYSIDLRSALLRYISKTAPPMFHA